MNLIHPILISAQYRFQSVSVFNLNYYYHYATSIITISLQVCSPFDFISFGLLNAARKLPYFPISYVDVSASVSSISLYDLRVLDEYNIFSIFMLNVICYFFPLSCLLYVLQNCTNLYGKIVALYYDFALTLSFSIILGRGLNHCPTVQNSSEAE